MANVSKYGKQKPLELTQVELIEREAEALALLIYDIYQDKKRKEQEDANS